MQAAYFSDLHLDLKSEKIFSKIESFMQRNQLRTAFVTGDISNGIQISYHLKILSKVIPQIYFVLGNHCYYFGSIFKTEDQIQSLMPVYTNLHWLSALPPIEIVPGTALIGSEGWVSSKAGLENFCLENLLIKEFPEMSFPEFQTYKNTILEFKLKQAARKYGKVVCLTHFPPVWNTAHPLDFYFQRYNVNSALKRILDEQNSDITVYAGHTHDNYSYFGKKFQCHTIKPSYTELTSRNIITL